MTTTATTTDTERKHAWPVTPSVADLYERAFGLLANVSGGNLTEQSAEWQEAFGWFRDDYHAFLAESSRER